MSIEIIWSCPLGHTCEEVRDGAIHRCAWLMNLKGKDPQSEDSIDDWRCAIVWGPLVGVENSQTNRGQTVAIEKLHGTVAKRQLGIDHGTQRRLGDG